MQRSKVALLSALFIPVTAFAGQVYEWKDASGKTHYSDRPPVGVDAKPTQFSTGQRRASPPTPSTPGDTKQAPQTWTERLKQMNERQRESDKQKAEADQKTKDEKLQQEACDEAKRQKAMLESGQRVRSVDENGESVVLDDAGRAEAIERLDQGIERACNNPRQER